MLQTISPVIIKAPSNPTETIENIEEDGNLCIIMVVVDECQTKCFAEVPHQAVGQINTEEAQPYLIKQVEMVI